MDCKEKEAELKSCIKGHYKTNNEIYEHAKLLQSKNKNLELEYNRFSLRAYFLYYISPVQYYCTVVPPCTSDSCIYRSRYMYNSLENRVCLHCDEDK